ncbi:MAG: TerB family tellurite resistance protein [Burkholderiales bacterium]|nr:TerB family tellurite resistance protein [Burkholderiales bacterium]
MLRTLKRLFDEAGGASAVPGFERRQLQLAVAVLLHESTRVDLAIHEAEQAAAEEALTALFGLDAASASALLTEAGAKTGHLTSYYAQVAVIKRDFSMEQRVALIEHLWRIAYAHHPLDPYEDHFVRKIAHLLYVPNTQVMLARSRARG